MSAVEISYKGSQIASMDATGVKTLLTGDTFCEDDIVIQYTAPSAPTPTGTKQITISGAGTVTEDVTNYASVEVTTHAGTAGTPTATKGAVSGNAVFVTPSVTNSAGWVASETKSGTPVSVTAAELVSGTLPITENGTVDVTNYAAVDVNVSGGGTQTTTAFINDDIGSISKGIYYFDASGVYHATLPEPNPETGIVEWRDTVLVGSMVVVISGLQAAYSASHLTLKGSVNVASRPPYYIYFYEATAS